MRPFNLFIAILFLCFTCSLNAQQRTCGSTFQHWDKHTQQPGYEEIRAKALQTFQARSSTASCDTILIPVVVHIVYHTPEENLSDEQVQSQIDALNEDYSATNATITDVPDAWKPLITDSKIRFCLAKQNPANNNTTGITRTYTNETSFDGTQDKVKFDSLGGANGWSPNSYFNIWVCNLTYPGGSILGISTFPGNVLFEPEKDGVIINYAAFGRTGDLKKKYNLGRTATHESGHWLEMFHIWGDDAGACSGSDQINDTPDQADNTYGSPKYPKYDNCSPSGDGFMFMNYMDYSDDKVMMFFTPNQIDTMRTYFGLYRDSICFSKGTVVASLRNHDLELEDIISPVTQSATRCFQPVVRVRNNGLDSATHFQLVYNIDSGEKRLYMWSGTLLSGNAVDITLPNIAGIDGLNLLEARIIEQDNNTVNNYHSRSYKVSKENTSGCDDCAPVIYPNPVTTNSFCVKSCFITSDKLTIRVINILGQKIFEEKEIDSNPGDVFPINLGKQAKGVYIVQMIIGKDSRAAKLIYLPGDNASSVQSICN